MKTFPKFIFNPVFFLTLALLTASNFPASSQCSEFYGMTSLGGDYNKGTIFKVDENGTYQLVHSFENLEGDRPYADLCEASNGKFYGMTSQGGINNDGLLFEWDPSTNDYFKKLDFDSSATGHTPTGSLIQAVNGRLYGMTPWGGANNMGVIFEWDPVTNTFIKEFDFSGTETGSNPNGSLIQADNGKIYGMTLNGGIYNMGILFEWDPSNNTFIKKLDFNGSENGKSPFGSLIQAFDGMLYGMTSEGGLNNEGVLFAFEPDNSGFAKKVDFAGTEKGKNPHGSLLQAENHKLYGMTLNGGINNNGVIFEFDPAADSFQKRIDFDNRPKGRYPYGSLIQGNNGKIYGMTYSGGWYGSASGHPPGPEGQGVIFEWDPVTNIYVLKIDLGFPKLGYPFGSLTLSKDGRIYGMACTGNGIFEWEPLTNNIVKRIEFMPVTYYYQAGSLLKADNGKIYGIYSLGGGNKNAALFEIDPLTNTYIKKKEFVGSENGLFQVSDEVRFLTQSKSGKILGIAPYGGTFGYGVLFEWDPASDTYSKKMDFQGTLGKYPRGLVEAENGKFYGMTEDGGKQYNGVIFEWDETNNIYTVKFEFNKSDGSSPEGALIRASDGKLYGMTTYGGYYDEGVLFEWDPITDTFTKKIDFDKSVVENPRYSLVEAENGKMYFTGRSLFEWDPITNKIIDKYFFNDPKNATQPEYSLIKAVNGNLYGVTTRGGLNDKGFLFEFNVNSGSYKKLIDFGGNHGIGPICSLTEILSPICNSITACDSLLSPSGKYTWRSSGVYRDTISTSNGNDSILLINLIIEKTRRISEWTVCDSLVSPSGRYTWKTDGVYYDTLKNSSACNKIITVKLKIVHPNSSKIDVRACETFTSPSGKHSWTSSGVYTDTIPNMAGCDSIITINLVISKKTYSKIYPIACVQYTSPSGKYTWLNSSTHRDTIPNAAGCDSIITIYLKIATTRTSFDITACGSYTSPSGRYTWNENGTYSDTIPGLTGCDSILNIYLKIINKKKTIDVSACKSYTSQSGKYTWTQSGTYIDTVPNLAGCDSIITFNLRILESRSLLNVMGCDRYLSPSGKYEWTTSGIYHDTLPNAAGCDSMVTINLTINHPSPQSTVNLTACDNFVSPGGKYTWTQTGTYTDTIPSSSGCDSVITFNLKILKSTTSEMDTVTCFSFTSPSKQHIWKEDGTYTDILPNSAGCDSTITIHLTVKQVNTNVTQEGYGLQAAFSNGTYQWINCQNNSILAEETNQSYTAQIPGNYAVIISDKGCADTSSCYTILATSFSDYPNHKIILYPNPTNGSFTIDLGEIYPEIRVSVTNPQGENVFREKFHKTDKIKITEALPPGLYVVTVNTGERDVILKLVRSKE